MGAWILSSTVGIELRRQFEQDCCPVCGEKYVKGSPGDQVCVHNKCGAVWGWENCKNCNETVPKLLPGRLRDEVLLQMAEDAETPWKRLLLTERIVGRDRVSRLDDDPNEPGSFHFMCPVCGENRR